MTDRPELEPGRNLPLPFQGGTDLPAPRQQQVPVYYPEEEESISLEHYLHVLIRRRWMLAAIAITLVVLAALQVFTATPMYRASARLQIDPESSRVVPFQEVAGSEMAGGWFMENYMWTQTENLQSHDTALRVVQRLELKNNEAFNQSTSPGALVALKGTLIKLASQPFAMGGDDGPATDGDKDEAANLASRLQGGVEAQPIRNTRLIEVSYTGPDAQLAANIVNTLIEEFIEDNLEGKYNAAARANDFPRIQLQELQIEVEKSEQELKEAGVAAGLRSSNIRIADTAKLPRSRATPRRSRTLLLALILGLFVGTGTVFLFEALDNTLETSDDVTQHLGLPALGVVPSLGGSSKPKHRFAWPFGNSAAKMRPYLVQDDEDLQQARALEAYRSLRTALLLSHSGNPPQAILVTSALPGEGKSTTVANIAVALAQTGSRTVIIDLDMRQPKLAEAFGISAEQGMSTFLSGNSDISSQIHETGVPNLFLVPSGPKAPNPGELISSEQMFTGLLLVRESFTYVVIDSPPILELSDALAASPHVDGVILVAKGAKTSRKTVQQAANSLLQVGAKLFGVLVNDVDVDKAGHGDYGYASSYFDPHHCRGHDSSQRTA